MKYIHRFQDKINEDIYYDSISNRIKRKRDRDLNDLRGSRRYIKLIPSVIKGTIFKNEIMIYLEKFLIYKDQLELDKTEYDLLRQYNEYRNLFLRNFSDLFKKIFIRSIDTNKYYNILLLMKIYNEGYRYVDIGRDSVMNVSFLPSNAKVEDPWSSKKRSYTRIGRILNKIGLVSELFANKYIAELSKELGYYKIIEVKGDEIEHWYDVDNTVCTGDLRDSCMRDKSPDIFKIYMRNPEVCSLLILRDKSLPDQILGRALLWKTNMGMYMDRVYVSDYKNRQMFINYASEHGYLRYDENKDRYTDFFVRLKNRVKPTKCSNPYMDTFIFYNYFKNTLSRDDSIGSIRLNCTKQKTRRGITFG